MQLQPYSNSGIVEYALTQLFLIEVRTFAVEMEFTGCCSFKVVSLEFVHCRLLGEAPHCCRRGVRGTKWNVRRFVKANDKIRVVERSVEVS